MRSSDLASEPCWVGIAMQRVVGRADVRLRASRSEAVRALGLVGKVVPGTHNVSPLNTDFAEDISLA